ncbi:MAG: PEP-CTERM sorting domain-containing protein [Pseudomonadota bacterium]
MRTHKLKLLSLLLMIAGANAQATLLSFDLNQNYGTVDAGGNVTVNITEAATAGNVHIDISNFTLGFLNEIYFNYAPNPDIAGGTISNFFATNGIVGNPSVTYNATQGFAIAFDFPNQPGTNFGNGESVSFDLSGSADLLVNGFNTFGGGPVGDTYYASAHINSVSAHGDCSSGSAKIGDSNGANVSGDELAYACGDDPILTPSHSVPEPTTGLLVGLGLASFAYRRRQKN